VSSRWFTLLLFTLPAVAADPPKHRLEGDAAIAARRVLVDHCAACHGDPDPKKGQGRFSVNDWGSLVGNAGPVPFVSQLNDDPRSQVLEFLKDGSMPPGTRPRPTQEEIAAVEKWVKLGATQYPDKFDDDAVLKLVTDDVARVEKEQGKAQVANTRYVSLAHLAEKKGADLAAAEADLFTALTGRTRGGKIRLTKPQFDALADAPAPAPLDKAVHPVTGSAGTVYRLDLKALKWDGGNTLLFEWTKFGKPEGDFQMKPFDLIQLEYPYTHAGTDPARAKAAEAAVALMNSHRNKTDKKDPLAQLRAVAFVRGDWLAKALWKNGTPTPLADDLDSLGELAGLLAKTDEPHAGSGPEFRPFQGGEKPADATAPSVWAWYQSDVKAGAPPFSFSRAAEGVDPLPSNGSFKLTGDSDKPAAVSLVEVQREYVEAIDFGDEKNPRPTLEVGKNTVIAPKGVTRLSPGVLPENGNKPMFYLLFVSPQATPHGEPVVVRSKHDKSAVWRVLPNAADAAAGRSPPVREFVLVKVKVVD
jgi:mono/diheme cytochrome c family protein